MSRKDQLLTLEDLDLYLLAHKAIRNELARFASRVPTLDLADGGTAKAAAMGQWFGRVRTLIELHHQGEDAVLFPLLSTKDSSWVAHEQELAADHDKLGPLLARIEAGFESLASAGADEFDAVRDRLGVSLSRLDTDMCDHLDREESASIQALTSKVTVGELQRVERDSAKHTPLRAMTLILPWIIDVANERERAKMDDVLPWPVKLLYRLSWKKKYERLTSPMVDLDLAATG